MKKTIILVLIAASIIFGSVFFLSRSIANAESSMTVGELMLTPPPTPGCPPNTYEHESICYPEPWSGEQQYGCFPLVDGNTLCIDPPEGTPTPSCPSGTYEHESICYPAPWSGEQQFGCFPTIDGLTICIDPPEPATPEGTPTPSCPSDTYEHESICYPEPWSGEQQFGCFPTIDGNTICIDPPEPATPEITPAPSCPSDTYEHESICYPEPWSGEQQFGCFPMVDGNTICIDPPEPATPEITPAPSCPSDTYEHESICYPEPWSGEQQFGCFPMVDGNTICIDPPEPATPEITPAPSCPSDTYEHESICYPEPWSGEQQFGCFPMVDGNTICIDPPEITPTPGCLPDSYEHGGMCYPEPWSGEQQFGCFPTIDGLTLCVEPPEPATPETTPTPGCLIDTYEHGGVCYPEPWTGEQQYGCFLTVSGFMLCDDPPEPGASTPGCLPDAYDHDGICYPQPWADEQQFGCFPTVGGNTLCIEPPEFGTPTPANTPCPQGTQVPQPVITEAKITSQTDALRATVIIEGRYLYNNVKINGPTGEYTPTEQRFDTAEFDVALVANSSNDFTVIKRINSGEVDPGTCNFTANYTWVAALQIEIVQSNDPTPSMPIYTPTPTSMHTPTPTSTPTYTPTPILQVVYPSLSSISPNPVAAGGSVEIIGSGGYLYGDDGFYNESARNFVLFFDGERISSIGCYDNSCRTELTIPADTISGTHKISVNGGSMIEIMVTSDMEPPMPTISVNHTQGAPGSVFLIEGGGFLPGEKIQIAITEMTKAVVLQSNSHGTFMLLLLTDNLASGVYELEIESSVSNQPVERSATVALVLDEAQPLHNRPAVVDSDVAEVDIAAGRIFIHNPSVFLPYLQVE